MNEKETKTPAYTKRAIDKYRAKKETTTLLLPTGTKEKAKQKYPDLSFNAYVNMLIDKDLNQEPKTTPVFNDENLPF